MTKKSWKVGEWVGRWGTGCVGGQNLGIWRGKIGKPVSSIYIWGKTLRQKSETRNGGIWQTSSARLLSERTSLEV